MSRRMKFQSIDAFEDWLVADIAKRIAVAEEAVVLNRLSGVTPGAGESVNSDVKIDSGNVLASQAYSDAVIRTIMSKIDENGQVVIYANATTIWTGLAGIVDADNNKIMIPNSQMDPVSQGRIYGAIVKKDSNIADNVAYFGVQGALKTNSFGGIEVFATQEAKTANMIYTGAEIFDAGLENPKAFVKVTFTVGE
jgi:HK97 family phage major capsid protein